MKARKPLPHQNISFTNKKLQLRSELAAPSQEQIRQGQIRRRNEDHQYQLMQRDPLFI